jgi:DNA-binding MarR family transcriptional regulator
MGESPEQIIESALADLFHLAANRKLQERWVQQARVPLTRTGVRALTRVTELGPLSVSALAAALEMSMPTASRQLRQLEEQQYVSRAADPSDGRTVIYTVTAKGRTAARQLRNERYRELTRALQGWDPEDAARAAELLRRLVDDMIAGREKSS